MSFESSEAKLLESLGARAASSDETVVRFDHVTKTYKLYKSERSRFLGLFNRDNRELVGVVNANDDLSFEIKKGEAVALIGRNGAGKSTALKMITGVSHPTKGTVTVKGVVSALLELNAGFDGQLTGRENLNLRSQVLGMSKKEYREIEERVIDFAELGIYIDQPMKSYSSGMKARLGFSFAASIDPDILVVDEALSVGDRAFKRKCINRMQEIMSDENVTVLFVTHESKAAQEFCTRGIVMDKGKSIFDGTIDDAIEYYEEKID